MFLIEAASATRNDIDLLHCAAFITFFPHLIAGPIVRPHDIIPQLRYSALASPQAPTQRRGLLIFLLGLAQEAGAGGHVRRLRGYRLRRRRVRCAPDLLRGLVRDAAYALQIYFDFSGYSDMAIGLARMMNIRFPLNFDSPYQAHDIARFWRRWHITLGHFLRDYVYIPLGGSRRGEWRRIGNLLLTMLLCGLWHGAAWRFVLWGVLHGIFLIVPRRFRRTACACRCRWRRR